MTYKRLNTIIGWLVFLVAAFTYCSTIEPTASFWDCPEFITTGYKLEVGHPPGAPIFMLTANLFSQLTNDPSQVAMMVNTMSALLSALCILFLFWSITMLAKKLVARNGEPTAWQMVSIFGSGIVGALAYTWSDTFWFSAVEGEVYAYSSFCTAVTFWLILKWEEDCENPHSSRWLVLIAYLIGVSVGVHLLNLLCITAIVLVYYFKKADNPTWKGGILAFCLSGVIIAAVLYGIVPGIVKVGGWFELLFVNGFGLPFNTGLIIYIILLVGALIWSVYETQRGDRQSKMYLSFLLTIALAGIPFYGHKAGGIVFGIVVLAAGAIYLFSKSIAEKAKPSASLLNTIMLCVMSIVIGYSSYAVIVVRSTANPPMDQNSPEDIFSLGDYLAREQYGSRPLFYGQTYASQLAYDMNTGYPKYKSKGKTYGRKEKSGPNEKDSYYVMDEKREYIYAQNMLFPRMYSSDGKHIQQYKAWCGGIKGHTVNYNPGNGQVQRITIPTQLENLKFFFRYQVNFMYWRYFMWNFAGRQNDIQNDYGEAQNGNWITGIKFVDRMLIGGVQDIMPDAFKGKGRNVFYCLPLLLGIIGLCWQFGKGKDGVRQFTVILALFFMTGLAIVVYLNQTPLQPRERDYAYAGSFYAFAIWIGLGVAAVSEWLGKLMGEKAAPVVAFVLCLFVPIQMVGQTWDDHDRSNRYACRDFGQNYLVSLPEQGAPIIFTNGDNDTFPLWYNFETEGFRTDARCCNLSYLMTDWYIDQMKRPAYDSPALPISFERIDYETGTNDYVPVEPTAKQALLKNNSAEVVDKSLELHYVLDYWVKKNHIIPADTIWLKIDKDAVIRSGMKIPDCIKGATVEETKANMPDRMIISLKGKRYLYKNELMMLDIIANANWERPLYIATTVPESSYLGLKNHFVLEGLAFRITPFNWKELADMTGVVDTDKMYANLLKFKFGGLDNPDIYIDQTIRRMCISHRRIFDSLVGELVMEGKIEEAARILNIIDSGISEELLPRNETVDINAARNYLSIGNIEKSASILTGITDNYIHQMYWFISMNDKHLAYSADSFISLAEDLDAFVFPLMRNILKNEIFNPIADEFSVLCQEFQRRTGIDPLEYKKRRR